MCANFSISFLCVLNIAGFELFFLLRQPRNGKHVLVYENCFLRRILQTMWFLCDWFATERLSLLLESLTKLNAQKIPKVLYDCFYVLEKKISNLIFLKKKDVKNLTVTFLTNSSWYMLANFLTRFENEGNHRSNFIERGRGGFQWFTTHIRKDVDGFLLQSSSSPAEIFSQNEKITHKLKSAEKICHPMSSCNWKLCSWKHFFFS